MSDSINEQRQAHIHDSDTAYDGWCASCPEPVIPLRTRLSYWLRPYDMHLDRRRWRWAKSGHRQSRDWLARNPWVITAAQCRFDAEENDRG